MIKSYLFWLVMLMLAVGCAQKQATTTDVAIPHSPINASSIAHAEVTSNSLAEAIWAQGTLSLEEADKNLSLLEAGVADLLKSPTASALNPLIKPWQNLAEALNQFALFAEFGRQNTQLWPHLQPLYFYTAAWPVHQGRLDATPDNPYSGLVFELSLNLTPELLRQQHGLTDSADALLGIYAIEALMLGANRNQSALLFLPETQLSQTQKADGYQDINELPRNRRRQLLHLQMQLLREDLNTLVQNWKGEDYTKFLDLSGEQQHQLIRVSAIGLLNQTIVFLENPDKMPLTSLAQHQQLADRLSSHLTALIKLHQAFALGKTSGDTLNFALQQVNLIKNMAPLNAQGKPQQVRWPPIRKAFMTVLESVEN